MHTPSLLHTGLILLATTACTGHPISPSLSSEGDLPNTDGMPGPSILPMPPLDGDRPNAGVLPGSPILPLPSFEEDLPNAVTVTEHRAEVTGSSSSNNVGTIIPRWGPGQHVHEAADKDIICYHFKPETSRDVKGNPVEGIEGPTRKCYKKGLACLTRFEIDAQAFGTCRVLDKYLDRCRAENEPKVDGIKYCHDHEFELARWRKGDNDKKAAPASETYFSDRYPRPYGPPEKDLLTGDLLTAEYQPTTTE